MGWSTGCSTNGWHSEASDDARLTLPQEMRCLSFRGAAEGAEVAAGKASSRLDVTLAVSLAVAGLLAVGLFSEPPFRAAEGAVSLVFAADAEAVRTRRPGLQLAPLCGASVCATVRLLLWKRAGSTVRLCFVACVPKLQRQAVKWVPAVPGRDDAHRR